MPKKKKTTKSPSDYFDMKEKVEKDKKVKQSDVFGKGKKDDKKKDDKKKKKKAPPGYHYMPNGKLMKDSDMKKSKNKTTKKKSSY
jgi:hypothetical protein